MPPSDHAANDHAANDDADTTGTPATGARDVDEGQPAPGVFRERRCWRCLQMFPGDAPDGPSGAADFWLCDPCDTTLIPQRTGRR